MENWFGPMMIVVVLLIVAVGFTFSMIARKKRREALRAMAATLGFEFIEKHVGLPGEIGSFSLGSRGRGRRAYNVMQGTANNIRTVIFDYRYTTGSGKNSHTFRQTVVLLEAPTLDLPDFCLRPESIFHKIGNAFGYKDIDFPDYPEFSRKFLLKGQDEGAVRAMFTPSVLTLLEQKNKISVEGLSHRLIFYRRNRRVKPEDLQDLLKEAFEVLTVLRAR